MPARRIFDVRMNDGSRHFGDLPETYEVEVPQWERLRERVGELAGAELTGFVTDQVTEAWIDFAWRGHGFSINNQHGQWWFFVADPGCPDALLGAVLDHFEPLLAPIDLDVPDGYAIGRARPEELAALPGIEDAAAVVFPRGLLSTSGNDPGLPASFFAEAAIEGRLWVARVIASQQPVGFVATIEVDGEAHLHEMDVLPDHARRGLGRALVEHVAQWATMQRYAAITLLTFRDVPFNGPFYRSAGFVELDDAQLGPQLLAMRIAERHKGLDLAARIAMRRMLSADAEP